MVGFHLPLAALQYNVLVVLLSLREIHGLRVFFALQRTSVIVMYSDREIHHRFSSCLGSSHILPSFSQRQY